MSGVAGVHRAADARRLDHSCMQKRGDSRYPAVTRELGSHIVALATAQK